MQRILVLLTLLLCAMLAASASALSPVSDQAALRSLLDQFLDGASRNDAEMHDRFWADDLIYTRSAGVRIDKAELMKGVRTAPAPKPDEPTTVFTAEEVQIHTYGTAAVVAFKLVGTTTASDGKTEVAHFLNTGTFIRREGQWQAVAWQSTRVPEPAAEAK
jgi:hypothetical protein